MVAKMNDGFSGFQRPGSSQSGASGLASLHEGIVTKTIASSRSAYVRVPTINPTAELGPFKVLQHFYNPVVTNVKQTVQTTSASDPDGGTFLTDASLSSSTTPLTGVYQTLTLPTVGSSVLVALLNNSLDEGVIVGFL